MDEIKQLPMVYFKTKDMEEDKIKAIEADGYEFDWINGWLHITQSRGLLGNPRKVFSERISNVVSIYVTR